MALRLRGRNCKNLREVLIKQVGLLEDLRPHSKTTHLLSTSLQLLSKVPDRSGRTQALNSLRTTVDMLTNMEKGSLHMREIHPQQPQGDMEALRRTPTIQQAINIAILLLSKQEESRGDQDSIHHKDSIATM